VTDQPQLNRRILVIDDNEAIHADFCKVLTPATAVSDDLLATEAALFGDAAPKGDHVEFDVTCASQGEEGYHLVRKAAAEGKPYAMAFVDMRMPPGWDGLETISRIWAEYPDIEMVICTAFSDYSWEQTLDRLGRTDRLLIVKKPFDPVEVLQVASALTHKWNLQQQAAQRVEDLSRLVSERTKDLERARNEMVELNGELITARDAAEAANSSKSMFLANISHELRTPMTAIVGFADEVHDRLNGRNAFEEETKALETIRRNARHMIGIIGDLLDVSKLEAGKLSAERIPCEPLHIANEVIEMLLPKALDKGLQLQLNFKTAVPTRIESDPLRLRQILLNLVDNAIKFTAEGSVTLTIWLEQLGAITDNSQLFVSVKDSGTGMTSETLQRLFTPFEQADVSTTRKFGGTGLGLAISRQLAQLLGGDIQVDSQDGEGSTFLVSVATGPLTTARMVTHPSQLSSLTTEAPSPVAIEAPDTRVLLVEDGLDNQRLIKTMLKRAKCTVESANNGAECLDRMAAEDANFDVILMDLQMPVMDGLTATRHLRKDGATLPIIALTACSSPSDEANALEAGCDAFLTKPINRGHLIQTIASITKDAGCPT